MRKSMIYPLVEGAILVAIAQVLSFIKIWEMPWGGSVVLSMVPLVLFSVRWGLGYGLGAGFLFGFLQFMTDGGFAISWQSMLGDYFFAFAAIGLAGLVHGKKNGIFFGTVIAGIARFIVHYVVGATVWAEYMPETFFNMSMTTPWIYSCLYNMAYMLPNIIITLVVFAVLWFTPVKKYLVGADIR